MKASRRSHVRRRLLLAAALLSACRTTPNSSPPPSASGDASPVVADGQVASDRETPRSAASSPAAGAGLELAPDLATSRIAEWQGVRVLQSSLNLPTGTPDLPGRTTGVLWATSMYEGRDDCVARDPNDRVEYHFSRGSHSGYALYFPSDGRGFNFLRQWIVPLPDGTTTKYDAAKFRADTANAWGLHACAHLVELDVNDGRGGRGLHFVATGVRVLDGTTAYPWSLARLLQELRDRGRALADEHAIRFTRNERGPWREQVQFGMSPTWIDPPGGLDVLVWQTRTRTTEHGGAVETVRPTRCENGTPCA